MVQNILWFSLGLAAIIRGGDWFVEAAVWVARRFGISPVVVGATVVSIGTSLPETIIAVVATFGGSPGMVTGTAVGSVIANIGLVLALALIGAGRVEVDGRSLRRTLFMLATTLCFWALAKNGLISRGDALVLVLIAALYLFWNGRSASDPGERQEVSGSLGRGLAKLFLGALLVSIGAQLLVDSGSAIARVVGVSETVIALVLLAVGSSLPELVTALTAAQKGYTGIFVGNVIGANVFNLTQIVGLAGLIRPVPIEPGLTGMDIPVALAFMGLWILPVLIWRRLSRWQGWVLLLGYLAYLSSLLWLRPGLF